LNPTPSDVRQHILTTSISLDEAACDLDLVLSVAEYFNLMMPEAKRIIREVAAATEGWRVVARALGASNGQIDRMSSAFEHEAASEAKAL
jgi:serine/threonine-protein kinase HipA